MNCAEKSVCEPKAVSLFCRPVHVLVVLLFVVKAYLVLYPVPGTSRSTSVVVYPISTLRYLGTQHVYLDRDQNGPGAGHAYRPVRSLLCSAVVNACVSADLDPRGFGSLIQKR